MEADTVITKEARLSSKEPVVFHAQSPEKEDSAGFIPVKGRRSRNKGIGRGVSQSNSKLGVVRLPSIFARLTQDASQVQGISKSLSNPFSDARLTPVSQITAEAMETSSKLCKEKEIPGPSKGKKVIKELVSLDPLPEPTLGGVVSEHGVEGTLEEGPDTLGRWERASLPLPTTSLMPGPSEVGSSNMFDVLGKLPEGMC